MKYDVVFSTENTGIVSHKATTYLYMLGHCRLYRVVVFESHLHHFPCTGHFFHITIHRVLEMGPYRDEISFEFHHHTIGYKYPRFPMVPNCHELFEENVSKETIRNKNN